MKKPENMLREYARRLSEEELKFLQCRLSQKFFDDTAEVLQVLGKANEVDRWLITAKSHQDFYKMLNVIEAVIDREYSRRFNSDAA